MMTLSAHSERARSLSHRSHEVAKADSSFDGAYSLAPLIHSRIVAYSGESLVNRMPPPCDRVADPATPSVSALDVGLRRIKLFSGSAWSTTFNAVENVALNSVCVEWQCTQAYPSRPRLVRIGST